MSRVALLLVGLCACDEPAPYWMNQDVPNNGPSEAEMSLCLEVEAREIDLGEIDLVEADNPFPAFVVVRNTCEFPVARFGLVPLDRTLRPASGGGRISGGSEADVGVMLTLPGRGEGSASADLLINNTQRVTRITWSWHAVGPEFAPVEAPEPLEVRLGCRGTRRIELENIGEHTADVEDLLPRPTDNGVEAEADLPATVAPGEILTVDITWTPLSIHDTYTQIAVQHGAESTVSGLIDPALTLLSLPPDPDTPCP